MKAVKQSVHRMTSQLQLISSYLETEDYTKALCRMKETIKEMHALEARLTGLVTMTVPESGTVGPTWFHSRELRRCECGR